MNPMRSNPAYVFDDVRVDVAAMRVTKGGRPVTLEPKAFDVLLHLLENPGVLVRKAQLLEVLWPDTFVTENNLAHAVSQLRRVLGDSAKCARYIETVPRRGYRFIAAVVVEPTSVLSESTLLVTQLPPQVRVSTIASPPVRNTFNAVDFLGTLAGRSWRTALFPKVAWVALCAVLAAGAFLLSRAQGARVSTSPGGTSKSVIPGSGTATAKAISEAYELSLRGQFNRQLRSAAAIARSIDYFERALAIDPTFAPALAGLAGAKFEQDVLNGDVGASRREVRRLAGLAIDADPTLAEAHVEMGRVLGSYDWNWEGSEAAFKRAIELKPTLALAYSEYSFLLQAQARFDEAVAQARQATAIDPSPLSLSDEGRALFRARRFSEAEDRYLRALALDPGFTFTFGRLAELYVQQRQFTEARQILDRLEQVPPRQAPRGLRLLLAAASNAPAAIPSMTGIVNSRKPTQTSARIFVAQGDHDAALSALEQKVAERRILPFRLADPNLDPLRGNPRFARLAHRMGLPVESLVALGRKAE